jgi:flagellar protein FlgJ
MGATDFVKKYFPYAKKVEEKTGIPAVAILAQAALESGWGKRSIGNNIFGIKFRKGDPGYRKVLTTEYSKDQDAFKGAEIQHKDFIPELNKYKFKIWQYFADYKSPEQAFEKHAELLLKPRYKHALKYKDDPKKYLKAIAESGYATAPNYAETLSKMVDAVKRRL